MSIVSAVNSRATARFCRGLAILFAVWSVAGFAHADSEFFSAVIMDKPHLIEPMLTRGLNPNIAEPERGDTGLILALRENSMEVFRLLLARPNINIEAKAKNGDNALMIAAWKNNRPAVEALLKKEAKVNRPGWTALHYAAAIGADDIVQLLLNRSVYVDAESPNGTTPLMMAARGGHIYTVKLLHDNGADATLKNALGLTAIDFARENGHEDIAEGLIYRIAKQERERKKAELALKEKMAKEAALALLRMLRPDTSLPACMADGQASAFYRVSIRSEAPLVEFPDGRD